MSERKIPYKIYLEESEMPKDMVQYACRYEEQTGAAFESGDVAADDRRRTLGCVLQRAGGTRIGQR